MAERVDVAIVGAGPVGAVAANLCGIHGLSAVAFDRAPDVYDLPRAVAMWDDVQRIVDGAGLLAPLLPDTCLHAGAEFVDSSGRRIIGIDLPPGFLTPNGHPPIRAFHQPDLERVARSCLGRFPAVHLQVETEVLAVEPEEHGVSLRIRGPDGTTRRVESRWLLGCDGATSSVRKWAGIGWESLGYDHEWLVVDVALARDVGLSRHAMQICDPRRPTTVVPGPRNLHRWEFQLLPGETRAQMEDRATVRRLLEPWLAAGDAEVLRAVVYRFHATIAETFRKGSIFLAGDAAHQTPPFLGQGLCTGVRDVDSLVWKLAQVKRLGPDEALLDSYDAERRPMAVAMVNHSVTTGRLIEAYAAVERGGPEPSAELREYAYGGSARLPSLSSGWLEEGASPWIGERIPRARVEVCGEEGGGAGDFDEVVGPRWAVVAAADPRPRLAAAERRRWEAVGAVFVRAATGADVWRQVLPDDAVALVRPDRIVYGLRAGTTA